MAYASAITAVVLLLAGAGAIAQPRSFRDCADCPEMVAIPAGRFMMGVTPGEEDSEGLASDFHHRSEPRHEVRVRPFSAGKYEITRREYFAFAGATGRVSDGCSIWAGTDFVFDPTRDWRNPGYPQDDRHPVVCVSWEDATAYTTWLSRRTGRRYRLLTEAEWEYAARAGTTTVRYWGDVREESCAYANVADHAVRKQVRGTADWPIFDCDDGHGHTAPVGSFRPNAFGLHDMLGNAWEWTQDCWNPNYNGAPTDGGAWTAGDCELRAVRGGSWEDSPVGARSAYRVGSPVVIRVFLRGFRVARDD
jgi:formylglycine-generating enzyme required for sulfatase activity